MLNHFIKIEFKNFNKFKYYLLFTIFCRDTHNRKRRLRHLLNLIHGN